MKIAVLYDSYYGNNKLVAEEIAKSFNTTVTLSHVKEFTKDGPYDLLVLGCPTRAMRPTGPMVRFIKTLSKEDAKQLAIYDTRMDKTKVPKFLQWMMKHLGHALETLEKKLTKKNRNWILDTNFFEVLDAEGPLKEGQLEKANSWGISLLENLSK